VKDKGGEEGREREGKERRKGREEKVRERGRGKEGTGRDEKGGGIKHGKARAVGRPSGFALPLEKFPSYASGTETGAHGPDVITARAWRKEADVVFVSRGRPTHSAVGTCWFLCLVRITKRIGNLRAIQVTTFA